MQFNSRSDLPNTHKCNICGENKPIKEMLLTHNKKENHYKLRPRCKTCHNEKERGHRREYKRNYLRRWRARNKSLDRSYWDNPQAKEKIRKNAYKRFQEKHEALLIQGRLRRKGMNISIAEAEELLEKYGRCYPTPQGLTAQGKKVAERIRSRNRNKYGKQTISCFQIRLIVYEDSPQNFIKPKSQPIPYKTASDNLKKYHRNKKYAG